MALEITGRTCEGCDGFTITDTTGLYNDPDNLTGYGIPNTITQPSGFDTYVLKVWYPESDLEGDPDYSVDLLTLPYPTPDADFHFSWTISASDMNLDVLQSGVWNFTLLGTAGVDTYRADVRCIFVKDVEKHVDAMMNKWSPTSKCGCSKAPEAFVKLLSVKCGGVCNGNAAQFIINELYDLCANC